MVEIKTKVVEIESEKRIALIFAYNDKLIFKVKQIEGRIWDDKEKFWHIPYTPDFLKNLNAKFEGEVSFSQTCSIAQKINKKMQDKYLKTLILKSYSSATVKSYTLHFQRFLNYYPKLKIEEITKEQIKEYLLYLVKDRHYSSSAQNQAINSIKFFYEQVQGNPVDNFYIPRPRIPRKYPKILNIKEVSLILKHIVNLRYKCMISLIYSAGLTPSEIVYLKIRDIDSRKMEIYISRPGEEKGRYVILSEKILILLREYFKKYNPVFWLFERKPNVQCTQREIQKAFKTAVIKSKIKKEATLTILRNSFATHLIDRGVDIRFVQQILGHKSARTTMRYLKVSKKDLHNIISPLDNLDI